MANPFAAAAGASNPFAAKAPAPAGANPFAAAAAGPAPAAANPFAAAAPAPAANPFAAAAPAPAANPFAAPAAAPAAANPFAAAAPAPAANPFAAAAPAPAAGAAANPFASTATATSTATTNPFAAASTTTNPFAKSTATPFAPSASAPAAPKLVSPFELTPETKLSEVDADVKKYLQHLNQCVHLASRNAATVQSHSTAELQKLVTLIQELEHDILHLRNRQHQQHQAIIHLKAGVEADMDHAEKANHQIRMPASVVTDVRLPSKYFWLLVERFEKDMENYAKQIALMEQLLLRTRRSDGAEAVIDTPDSEWDTDGLYSSAVAQSQRRVTPQLLGRILIAQNEAFTRLAGGKIADVHEKVAELKDMHLRLINQDPYRLFENPFLEADKQQQAKRQRELLDQRLVVPESKAAGQAAAAPASANPFAPAAGGTNPFASTNPFAKPGTAAANPFASPSKGTNPFAAPAPAGANPFASPSTTNPFAAPTPAPAAGNPFASPAASAANPFATPASATNPFAPATPARTSSGSKGSKTRR